MFLLRFLRYPNSDCLNIEIVILLPQRVHNFRQAIFHSLHQPKATTSSTMVFTATQITAFFTESTQMEIFAHTRQALEDEGISIVSYLHEWKDSEWDQFTQNRKRPPQIVNPNNYQALINQPAFKVPVKSLKRLKEVSRITCFYGDVGRNLS